MSKRIVVRGEVTPGVMGPITIEQPAVVEYTFQVADFGGSAPVLGESVWYDTAAHLIKRADATDNTKRAMGLVAKILPGLKAEIQTGGLFTFSGDKGWAAQTTIYQSKDNAGQLVNTIVGFSRTNFVQALGTVIDQAPDTVIMLHPGGAVGGPIANEVARAFSTNTLTEGNPHIELSNPSTDEFELRMLNTDPSDAVGKRKVLLDFVGTKANTTKEWTARLEAGYLTDLYAAASGQLKLQVSKTGALISVLEINPGGDYSVTIKSVSSILPALQRYKHLGQPADNETYAQVEFRGDAGDDNGGKGYVGAQIEATAAEGWGAGTTKSALEFKVNDGGGRGAGNLVESLRVRSDGSHLILPAVASRDGAIGTYDFRRYDAVIGDATTLGGLWWRNEEGGSQFANTGDIVGQMNLVTNEAFISGSAWGAQYEFWCGSTGASAVRKRLEVKGTETSSDLVVGVNEAQKGTLFLAEGNGATGVPYVGMDEVGGAGQNFMWLDDTGDLRAHSAVPTAHDDGAVVGTQTFTGSHNYPTDVPDDLLNGDAVCLVGGKVVRSSSPKDPRCTGIFTCMSDVRKSSLTGSRGEALAHVAGVGDAREFTSEEVLLGMKVCNEGGAVVAGDLLCTSSKAGHLMKQDDDLMHGYTVAKAMEDVSFDGNGNAKNVYGFLYAG